MVNNSITFIGLYTHKEFFEVAYIEDNREAKAVSFGRISARSMRGFGMEAKPHWKRRRRAYDC
jgi:hypothetical protein